MVEEEGRGGSERVDSGPYALRGGVLEAIKCESKREDDESRVGTLEMIGRNKTDIKWIVSNVVVVVVVHSDAALVVVGGATSAFVAFGSHSCCPPVWTMDSSSIQPSWAQRWLELVVMRKRNRTPPIKLGARDGLVLMWNEATKLSS